MLTSGRDNKVEKWKSSVANAAAAVSMFYLDNEVRALRLALPRLRASIVR